MHWITKKKIKKMTHPEYNEKGFLLPESIRSCASFHAKILPTGEYLFRIHDCITGIRLRGDLNNPEECEEAYYKLMKLSKETEDFANFIRDKYLKETPCSDLEL